MMKDKIVTNVHIATGIVVIVGAVLMMFLVINELSGITPEKIGEIAGRVQNGFEQAIKDNRN